MVARARRKRFGRRGVRAAAMAKLAETDPALHAELEELRRHAPHAFRKRMLVLGLVPDRAKLAKK